MQCCLACCRVIIAYVDFLRMYYSFSSQLQNNIAFYCLRICVWVGWVIFLITIIVSMIFYILDLVLLYILKAVSEQPVSSRIQWAYYFQIIHNVNRRIEITSSSILSGPIVRACQIKHRSTND